MKLTDIARELRLKNLTPEIAADDSADITGGYASDLLSDVLPHAPHGGVLVTVQVHMNVIAVAAVYAELAAVIFTLGRQPDEDVRQKAVEEGVVLYGTDEPTFDIAGKLYALGLRGTSE
ncbi:MAG: hypothetical protein QG656_359 [Candidatus Hydrogenedentes bacterium]|nr:hypothetical protein [Candidatus Hydrogenedentota bacterium]